MTTLNIPISIHLQVPEDFCGLIDRAATLARKTRASFVLDAVLDATEDVILDHATFCQGDDPAPANESKRSRVEEELALQRLFARNAPCPR